MVFICIIFYVSLGAKSPFISKDEYAKLLYKNPRGIGCDKCHGEKGEGKIISTYIHKGKEVVLIGPKINDISLDRFEKALDKGTKLMPGYFLTDVEKAYLYYYLIKQNKKIKKVVNVD